jgi:hypothetical protein
VDGVQAVALGDAFELMLAGVGECEAASGDEVFDCLGDKHLGSAGQGCDTSAGGDRDSCAFSVYQFAFSGVCTPARSSMPRSRTRFWTSLAQWMARAGPSKVA